MRLASNANQNQAEASADEPTQSDRLTWSRWRWSSAATTAAAIHLAAVAPSEIAYAAAATGAAAVLATTLGRRKPPPRRVQVWAAASHAFLLAAACSAGVAGAPAAAAGLLALGWTVLDPHSFYPVLAAGTTAAVWASPAGSAWAPLLAAVAAGALHAEGIRSAESLRAARERIGREREDGIEKAARVQRRLDHLEQVYGKAPVGLALVSDRFQLLRCNERMASLCSPPDDLDSPARSVRHALPEIGPRIEAICARVLKQGRPHLDLKVTSRGGKQGSRHWLVNAYPLQLPDGPGVSLVVQDVTEAKRDEHRLREAKERYELAARGANDGLWDWDFRTNRVYYSDRWKGMLGLKQDAVSDDPDEWASRVHPEDLSELRLRLREHLEGHTPHFECEYRMLRRSGEYRWMQARGVAVRDDWNEAYRMAGSQTDISARKSVEKRLVESAAHDALTGLPNRLLLSERLGRALAHARRVRRYRFALLFLDLDRFKLINDSLGHLAGDELLTQVARRLERCMRTGDTVARIGGDEFTILVEDIESEQQAIETSERVIAELNRPIQAGHEEVACSTSVGIALNTPDADTPEDILRNADLALYRAKAEGRGRWALYREEMHRRAVETLSAETALRKALESKQLHPWFQPVCKVEDGSVVGCEALVRWRRADGTVILPADFIPAAEDSGAVVEIGRLMLRESCRQARIWRDLGLPEMQVAVNVSVRQLYDETFLRQVEQALDENSLPPSTLELELTESALLEDRPSSTELLEKLVGLGVRIALDDFGEGYSSLSYLHRYRLSTLKISDHFVREVVDNRTVGVITSGVIDLAQNLGLRVVAEGVETPEQLEFLQKRGCDLYQGALTAWPLPAEEMTQFLRSRTGAATAAAGGMV